VNYKRLIGVLLIIGVLLFSGLTSCGSPSKAKGGGQEFEAIRQAADEYVSSGKPLTITAKGLYDSIMAGINLTDYDILWYDPFTYTRAPFILDVRTIGPEMPDPYLAGHIPGSLHIPWQQVTQWRNLKALPTGGRQIVVVSNTGQIGAQVTAILNLLGYNAVNLMWGMVSWTSDPVVAPGAYDKGRDTVFNWGGSYRAVCPISEPTETYPLPVVENTSSGDKDEIILAAADKYLSNGAKDFGMTSIELYQALHYEEGVDVYLVRNSQLFQSLSFTGTATGNPYTVPFFLDVRDDELYQNGHLCGTAHTYWKDAFKKENLAKLPLDRPILVYGTTGHESGQVAALLNLLGYDAINLTWGVTSWSLALPGKDIAPDRFEPEQDCMNYPFVTGFISFEACPT
jgi:rhodanese-related sulfurtransferase